MASDICWYGQYFAFIIIDKTDQVFGLRVFNLFLQLKGPRALRLFSERYGYKRPFLKGFGWRLFVYWDTLYRRIK